MKLIKIRAPIIEMIIKNKYEFNSLRSILFKFSYLIHIVEPTTQEILKINIANPTFFKFISKKSRL